MKKLPIRTRQSATSGGWIEPLEARIAPANFDLTPFIGQGPFTLEVDPNDAHIHIISGAAGEIFDQTTAGPNDNLFVTGGGAADAFIIANSAGGNVVFTGTLSVIIPGQINVNAAAATGVDLVLNSTGAGINYSASMVLGTSAAHFTAAKNIAFTNGSALSAISGDIVLMANQGAGQNGTFAGITLDAANISTIGSGKIQLTGKGGNAANGNIGIALFNGAVISSTSSLAAAGTIDLIGTGGAGLANNQGVAMSGASTLITSARGAIHVTGNGDGNGTGNNVGVLMSNGAQIISNGSGTGAATITVMGTSGGGSDFNHGVFLDGTASDPKITSIDGNILVIGTGLATAIGQGARGISIEQGGQIHATGSAQVTLQGTGGGGTSDRAGVLISGAGTQVSAQNAAVNISGTGGAGAGGNNNNGVLVTSGGDISALGLGSLSVNGTEGGGIGSEGISLTVAGSSLHSTGGGGMSLTANNINLAPAVVVDAGTNVVKLKPVVAGTPIGLGLADIPGGLLGLTNAELAQITAGTIEIGDTASGSINVAASLAVDRNLVLTSNGSVNGNSVLTMNGATSLTINGNTGIDLSGSVVVTGGTATFSSGPGAAITLNAAGNNFGIVSIPAAGSVTLRDDSGFTIAGATVATLLSLNGAGAFTQTGPITGAGGVTKLGAGTLTLSAANTYAGATTLSAGTLRLGSVAVIPDGVGKGDVVVNAGTTLDLNGFNETVNGLSGAGTVNSAAAAALTVGNNGATSAFDGAILGSVGLTKIGNGTLTLRNTANNYTGNTSINAGTLTLGAAGVLPDAGTVAVNAAILDLNGFDETVGGFTLNGGSVLGGAAKLTSGTAFDLRQGSVSATLAGNVGALVGVAGGIVTLNATATYTGATEIRDGTLTLNGGLNLLPIGTSLILGDVLNHSGILNLNNFSQEVAGLTTVGTGANNQVIDSTADAVIPVLTVNLAGLTNTFGGILGNGPIANGFALTKTGAGTLVLAGTNTYTGTTTIGAGTLQIGDSGTSGTLGAGPVVNNGTLTFSRSDTLTVTNTISGNGSVAKSGGTLILSGISDYTGSTTVSSGALLVDGQLTNTSSVNVGSPGTLGGSGTIGAPINLAGGIAPGGSPGTLTTGNIVAQPGARMNFEINGLAPNHDQLAVTGSVTLANTALNTSGSIASAPGQQIVLIANDGNDPVVGTFSNLAEGAALTVNGLPFTISYAGGVNGNDVVITQAPPAVVTRVTLNSGNLVITDIAPGGHDDTLTVKTKASTGELLITDLNQLLEVVNVPGATISPDQHTVTVPYSAISGTLINITTLAGDDAVNVDVSNGALPKPVSFDGGNAGLAGDRLTVNHQDPGVVDIDVSDVASGFIGFPTSLGINYADVEGVAVLNTTPGSSGSYALRYDLNVPNTINVANGGGGNTLITATTGASLTLTNQAGLLQIFGGTAADTINVNSLDAAFPGSLAIDGRAGADTVNLGPGLPALGGLTITTESISALPALTLGAGGLDVTVTAGGIGVMGSITSTGPVSFTTGGAITSAATIAAQQVSATATGGIALTLDGANVSLTNNGSGGVSLQAVNNPVVISALVPGTGGVTLGAGSFTLTKANAISGTPALSVGGALDLKGFPLTVDALSGAGSITNSSPALSAFTVGFTGGSGTYTGTLGGHLALEKLGAGTQVIGGAHNAADGTTVTAGVLRFEALGSALSGRFTLAGGTLAYNLPAAAQSLSPNLILTADSTIEVGTSKTVTLTDPISGPGGVTKTGAGTLVLTNQNNSFGGQTTKLQPAKVRILGGTLQVPNDGALGDVANDVEINNATFATSGSFASARNFTKASGSTATVAAQPTLSLINKATDQLLFGANPANVQFTFPYADTTPVPNNAVTIGNTQVSVAGGGTLIVHKTSPTSSTIDAIEITGSTSKTNLIIKAVDPTMVTTINRIVIDDAAPGTIASIGTILLGKNVFLGDGVRDSVPDIYVEGKAGKITLDDVNSYVLMRLGEGLPYNVPDDKKTPDTYNNRPALAIHKVRGPGMVIDLTPSDLPLDGNGNTVGGGGLGKVAVDTWDFSGPVSPAAPGLPGMIRTTQSIGSFKLLHGDCSVVFEVDKLHVGTVTRANVGSMTIQSGSWGSSGSEIEGDVGSFNADDFLAGATLTAGSMGKFTLDAGAFAGYLQLGVDPDGSGIPTFTVATNFSGTVVSDSPLQKIRVRGDFTGELQAPFIGSITAYDFLGTNTPGEYNQIIATAGSLGTLTATAGVVKNFAIITDQAFKGFNVKLSKLTTNTVGIDNVHVEALSIGNISVNLAAAAGSNIDLVGIRNSDFIATGTGTTKTTMGSIGNISVTLSGSATSTGTTGISGAFVSANATVGAVTVKSKVLAHGSIADSQFLAGQGLVLDSGTTVTSLGRASLGAVNVTGSIIGTDLVAGGSIGAVTAGESLTDSLILAGALLGHDGALGGISLDADQFHRAASIAAVTVKGSSGGTFARTSIIAGVNPVNGIFGDAGDILASAAGLLSNTSFIGPITIPNGVLAAVAGSPQFAIEAAKLTSLKPGPAAPFKFSPTTQAQILDLTDDIMVRVVA